MALRPITEADLPLVLKWRNSPDVRKNMFSTHEISEAEHRAWFARMEHDSQSRWYIHETAQGVLDGVAYFTQYRPDQRSAFWGFYLGTEAQPGSGTVLGLDALDEAFFVLKLHKLNAEAISTNERSLRFHQKLGFKQEGVFRDSYFDGEHFIDIVRYGLLSMEWAAHRGLVTKARRGA